jgi:hypothetical protein
MKGMNELQHRGELGRLRGRLAELERAQRQRAPSSPLVSAARGETLPTGFPELDERLGGGLRIGALNEILVATPGSGLFEAFLPALARPRADGTAAPLRPVAWVDLPQPGSRVARLPHPPALAQAGFDLARLLLVRPADAREQAWAIDLALRSGACDAVVARLPMNPRSSGVWSDDRALRRLQLAAEEGRALALLVRPAGAARGTSPAAVRLAAEPLPSPDPRRRRLSVTVLHCRGSAALPSPLTLEWSRDPLDEPAARATAVAPERTAALRPALALGA